MGYNKTIEIIMGESERLITKYLSSKLDKKILDELELCDFAEFLVEDNYCIYDTIHNKKLDEYEYRSN